jgi:hypothetical protein
VDDHEGDRRRICLGIEVVTLAGQDASAIISAIATRPSMSSPVLARRAAWAVPGNGTDLLVAYIFLSLRKG